MNENGPLYEIAPFSKWCGDNLKIQTHAIINYVKQTFIMSKVASGKLLFSLIWLSQYTNCSSRRPWWPCLFNEESVHSGHYGHHMGIHCNVVCTSIEIQIICNLFWTPGVISSTILISNKKKSGYTVEYWIFKTAQKFFCQWFFDYKF